MIFRMKWLFFLSFLCTQQIVSAQGFISLKRANVKKQLIKHYQKENIAIRFEETDSTLTSFLKDSTGVEKMSFSYFFKKNGRCYKETGNGACEHCYTKLFTDAKLVKRYKWKKVSDYLYLSKPLWNLTLIRTDPDNPFSYSIIKNYFTREAQTKLYKKLP
jgi:hypothetical protein